MIFQDPYSSLNPRMTVGQIIGEPLHVYKLVADRKAARRRASRNCSTRSGCVRNWPSAIRTSFPAASASASASRARSRMEPSFIVCDEAVSALDVSIQGQIINLLEDLQRRLGLAYLFIAHDLAVVRHISMRVVVMYFGRVMEIADRDTIYREPLHPYTKVLLDAAPVPDPTVEKARAPRLIKGELPSHLAPPTGCVFNTRCPMASAGMPRDRSAAGREAAGTFCRLHQGLTSGDNDRSDNTGGNAMTITRRTALKGMAGALRPRRGRAQLGLHAGLRPGRKRRSAAAR